MTLLSYIGLLLVLTTYRVIGNDLTNHDSDVFYKPPCEFIPEILLIQDATASYQDDQLILNSVLPDLLNKLAVVFQGSARFGLVTFADKPMEDCQWGYSNDYCAMVMLPLTKLKTVDDVAAINQAIRDMEVGGGWDYLDGSMEAVYRAVLSRTVGWSTDKVDPKTGKPIVKIIVLATDAAFHQANDSMAFCKASPLNYKGKNLPENDFIRRPEALDKDINAECGTLDHPSAENIAAALKLENIHPIVFAAEPTYVDSNHVVRVYGEYLTQIVQHYNFTNTTEWADPDNGLVHFYEDYFKILLNTTVFVKKLNNDSSNFVDIFNEAFDQLSIDYCKTTTPAPVPIPTKPITTTTTSTTGHTKKGGGKTGLVIGAASGGAAAALAAAVLAKRFAWSAPETNDMDITQEADHADPQHDREQFEAVTGDLFA